MNTLAIDPGYAGKGNACAAFASGELAETWFERAVTFGPNKPPPRAVDARKRAQHARAAGHFDEVVWEKPQQDARSRAVPPEILISLTAAGALLAGAFAGRDGARIIEYRPSEWKGSEPKPVMHRRMWKILSAAERRILGGDATDQAIRAAQEKGALRAWKIPGAACYPKAFDTHNILDAVALGCVHLGRLARVTT
jgi:hypothetical protein